MPLRTAVVPALLASAFVSAQASWSETATAPSALARLVWDGARGRALAVDTFLGLGSSQPQLRVWEWGGDAWAALLGDSDPGTLLAAVYDSVRDRVVAVDPTRIHEWDAARWTHQAVALPGTGAAVFDAARQRIVMLDHGAIFEWDGAQMIPGAVLPSPRIGVALAYDPSHQRCLLYGGTDIIGTFAELWSWDGSTLALLDANAAPGPLSGPSLAHEPTTGRMVLYGGVGSTNTWVYQAGVWSLLPTTRDPGARSDAQLVWGGSGLLLRGGDAERGAELWQFDGSTWDELPGAVPPGRSQSVVAWDPGLGTAVMFGGRGVQNLLLDDTWLFDRRWRRVRPLHAPSPRSDARMALSSVEQRLLLYGGSAALGDTWIWSGSDWLQQVPTTVPPPRDLPALATDPAGGVLLFGGIQAQVNLLNDQWRWNGVDWIQQAPAVAPSARAAALAVHDPVRNMVVLVGGSDGSGLRTDTWEWNGSQWAQGAAAPIQVTTQTAAIVFRPDSARVFVEAGVQLEWNGVAWATVSQQPNVPVNALFADPRRRRLLATTNANAELLTYTAAPAGAERYGNGCAIGSAPALATVGRPQPGNQSFRIAAATHAPGAPVFLALGGSAAPQPLGSGCSAWVGNVLGSVFLTASATGDASIALPLPGDYRLRGFEFFAQAAVVDPPRGLFQGLTLSEGLRVVIGD